MSACGACDCQQWRPVKDAVADPRLAALSDANAVHANILRGTIALTKAQAIHIAGLPADVEQRLAAAGEMENALKLAERSVLILTEMLQGKRRKESAEFEAAAERLPIYRAALAKYAEASR